MHGTIQFNSYADLAEFLRSFEGSTAVFTVTHTDRLGIVLRFTGAF